jgi:hypothetical protein
MHGIKINKNIVDFSLYTTYIPHKLKIKIGLNTNNPRFGENNNPHTPLMKFHQGIGVVTMDIPIDPYPPNGDPKDEILYHRNGNDDTQHQNKNAYR